MALIDKIIGPKSKYEKTIPYTYEARVEYINGESEYYSYLADTICGLIAKLEEKAINANQVTIFEIFNEQEKQLDLALCVSAERQWLSRRELCKSFSHHYEGHIDDDGCTFADRDGRCI